MPSDLLEPRTIAEVSVILAMVVVFGLYRLVVYLSNRGNVQNRAQRQDVQFQEFVIERLGMTMDELATRVNQMDKLQFQIQTLSTENAAFKFQVRMLQQQIEKQGEQLRELGETNQRQVRRIITLEYENQHLQIANKELRIANDALKERLNNA